MVKQEINCPHNKPISQCLEHWVVFCEQTGNTPFRRAIKWSLSDDTGISSKVICAHMLGFEPFELSPPYDRYDRGRCIRLLQLIPEWIPRLNELTKYDDGMVEINGEAPKLKSQTKYSWTYQIPIIISEGNF